MPKHQTHDNTLIKRRALRRGGISVGCSAFYYLSQCLTCTDSARTVYAVYYPQCRIVKNKMR